MSELKAIFKRLIRFLRLDAELESSSLIHESIEKGIIFKGTNLWILVFAIVVASVGLNMNSTAVIIGAMLISPLMGPINGIGYSIATYNLDLFRRSVKNFGFAVLASISASYIYFLLSPVSNAQSELLARTSPTIYDVLIALFGGCAGIVALSSKQKGNVIAGVAIATALMPPLCTVGYGLAVRDASFFFGAFYLFMINSVFIALSSMIVSQLLKFPKHSIISNKYKKWTKYTLYFVISITVLPSIYFGYTLVQKENFINSANKYVDNISRYKNHYLLKSVVDDNSKTIKLIYGGGSFSENQRNEIKNRGISYGLDDAQIIIEQGLRMDDFKDGFNEIEKLKQEFSRVLRIIEYKDAQIDSSQNVHLLIGQLFEESLVFFPEVSSISSSQTHKQTMEKTEITNVVTVMTSKKIEKLRKAQFNEWLQKRLRTKDSMKVVFELK